jgi:transcriptional antiterminator NusG
MKTETEKMALKWYVVHTYSGHEQKALKYLTSRIEESGLKERFGRILIPTQEVVEMKQGRRSSSYKKFLPSYLMIEMELDKDTQALVTGTPGITNFVGSGGRPTPLKPDEVERVLQQMEEDKTKEQEEVPFRAGDQVKVIDGPFTDFSGTISEVNSERNRVKVMVSIFGRPTPVELDYLQVVSAAKK